MKRSAKILLVFDAPEFYPRGYDFQQELKDKEGWWYTENNIDQALKANGYQVSLVGIHNDINPLLEEIKKNKPDCCLLYTSPSPRD